MIDEQRAEISGWVKCKDEMPPIGLVVEAFVSDGISAIRLHEAAYMLDRDGTFYWTFHGMDEGTWGEKGFGIKMWRKIRPLPNGTVPWFVLGKTGYLTVSFRKEK